MKQLCAATHESGSGTFGYAGAKLVMPGRVKPGHDENDSFSKRLESLAKWACFFGQALRAEPTACLV